MYAGAHPRVDHVDRHAVVGSNECDASHLDVPACDVTNDVMQLCFRFPHPRFVDPYETTLVTRRRLVEPRTGTDQHSSLNPRVTRQPICLEPIPESELDQSLWVTRINCTALLLGTHQSRQFAECEVSEAVKVGVFHELQGAGFALWRTLFERRWCATAIRPLLCKQ